MYTVDFIRTIVVFISIPPYPKKNSNYTDRILCLHLVSTEYSHMLMQTVIHSDRKQALRVS